MKTTINRQTITTPKNLINCYDVVNYETSEDKFIKAQYDKWVAIGEALIAGCIIIGLVSVISMFLFMPI